MERLIQLDQLITININGLGTPFWDPFMVFISRIYVWVPLYVAIVAYYFWKMPWKKALVSVLVLAAAFAFTDVSTHHMKTYIFCRLRPCHEPLLDGLLRLPAGKGGLYGFPSGHACNTFCFALITSWLSRRRWWTVAILTWSLAISYSRIYLAMHYLGDVLAGLLFGAVAASLAVCLLKFIFRKL